MRKLTITITIIALFLVSGCLQQPTAPVEPATPIEEPQEPKQTCTEMWICQNQNTKAYRKADCTFEQIADCPAGCENGECRKVIEEPKLEEPAKGETEEQPKKETCAIGWKCLDKNRRGYQSSNCMFSQVEECKYGCKDGECVKTAPPEEEKEETFSLTEGKGTMDMPGWKFFDFSKKQLFQREINDYDLKMKLYASASGYNYFRVESPTSGLWIIEKGIKDATRADCMAQIVKANAYGSLKTAQTVCIKTKEKNIALMGGYWEGLPKEDTELTWKYYS